MTKKNPNPPCIRNIDRFKKTGCPEKLWNGCEGCTAWVEMTVADKANPVKKNIVKGCIDIIGFELQYAQLGLLEGNQKATESFRNAMVYDDNGNSVPKLNPNLTSLYLSTKDQVDQLKKQQQESIELITSNQKEFIDFFTELAERNSKLKIEGSVDDKGDES